MKLTNGQAKAKQHPEAEVLLFKNYCMYVCIYFAIIKNV